MNPLKEYIYRAGLGPQYFRFWWNYRRSCEPKSPWAVRHQAFFVHIPKTAGTSLMKALHLEPDKYTHCPARFLKEIYPTEFASYFKFAVVRNPYDKFVSAFEYATKKSDWAYQREWAENYIGDASFSEFVTNLQNSRSYRNLILGNEFFLPQTFFVQNSGGQNLLDFVLKFETLREDFVRLRDQKFKDALSLSHVRKNENRMDLQKYYDEASMKFVKEYYAKDFEAFDYDAVL